MHLLDLIVFFSSNQAKHKASVCEGYSSLFNWFCSFVLGFSSHSRISHSYGDITIAGEGLQFLCRLPALANATYRDHFCRLALSLSSATQKISVTFFLGTKQASFLIVGTEHQDGELYRVTHFWIWGMSTSCLTWLWILWTLHRQICSQDNFCHIFLGNHRGQLPDI